MRPGQIVAVVFIVSAALVFVLVGVWDVVQMARDNGQGTVSSILRQWSADYPILPFVFGLLIGLLSGHLFWPGFTVSKE